jgi:hypothetical protein
MKIKDFEKFLEEITIKGNPAIPGEGEEREGENPYLSDVERRAKERMQITGAQSTGELGQKLNSLLRKSNEYIVGKEKKLEDLAAKVMDINFGWILDRYSIDLDIKLLKSGSQIKNFIDGADEEENPEAEAQFKEVTEEDIRNEVHKRKIANLIIQGEAKNTKHILHSKEVKDGLNEIYGTQKAQEIFNIWDEMSKTADKLDWLIPTTSRSTMMEEQPEGLAGACGYGWNKTEKEREEVQEEEPEEDYTEWTGGDEEEWTGGDEEEFYDEGGYTEFVAKDEFTYTPILRARGIDFPMLLHESVKGLFEILSLCGIPTDPRSAKVALSETGARDEPEDWKYGPEIARDFRDFVNKNPKVKEYTNIKEELFRMLIDENTMPTKEFLELFRGILSNKPFARRKIDKMIDEIIESIEEMERYNREMEQYRKDLEEYNKQMAAWEEYQRTKGSQEEIEDDEEMEPEEIQEVDPSKMTQIQIQKLIDGALDRRDIETVKNLSKYLKEGREIYLREIELILENKNRNRRR